MEVDLIIFQKLIEISVEKSVGFLGRFFVSEPKIIAKDINEGISFNLSKAITFSENLSTFKLPDTKDLLENSVQLEMHNQNRIFKAKKGGNTVTEEQLLYDPRHTLILGDVGAGKTTTLKRLVRKSFETLFSSKKETFPFSFLVVIKIAEIKNSESLMTHLCNQLRIPIDKVEIKDHNDRITGFKYQIGNTTIEDGLSSYLNDVPTIIFLDGLDEVKSQIRDSLFNEIKNLSQSLLNSKIFLTSRYIQEIGSFKQFVNFDICSLDIDQKKSICSIWLDNPKKFLKTLKKLPYYDLSDRPLFLTFLILIYQNNNYILPSRSIDIYRQIIQLVLRDWDDDKETKITRYSKYQHFDLNKKEDFLSELTYELSYTFEVKKTFNLFELESAYQKVYLRYPELTKNDSKAIIKDLESISGLIIELNNNNFEFSHLSLQEYLCAKYLISIPLSRTHYHIFNKFPSSVAVANVLSPRPAEWFAFLFINQTIETKHIHKLQLTPVYEFLDRLLIEKIHFPYASKELGVALIYLRSDFFDKEIQKKIDKIFKLNNVINSLNKALQYFYVDIEEEYITLKKNRLPFYSNLNLPNLDGMSFEFKAKYYWK
ncbi:NACHT domain-containing protein [Rasiella rasia]|uniref:NACHT domain-containing protein n=1 Tax=Rasiella rasia TaxID=2744027 RepID=A0A6G6GJL2_9FLAO|nr:NACHT domain-containing protein [Rasiella rasia]QIE58704.1 NACHT domain-containing protein [Rasiella rasia]